MPISVETILEHREDPRGLERLFREDAAGFRDSLPGALGKAPDAMSLRVWDARFNYRVEEARQNSRGALWYAIAIGLAVAFLVRVPAIWLDEAWFYPRYGALLTLLSVAAYFLLESPRRPPLIGGAAMALVCGLYVALLPEKSDSGIMALIHLPFMYWSYVGLVFLSESWRHDHARVRFVRYTGELVVLGSLVLLGGMVLSGLAMALFSLIDNDIMEWWVTNIVVMGIAATPVTATYLYDVVFNRRSAIAGVLARVFAPLFLVLVVSYLLAAFATGSNPFVDRSFLITFNGLLLVVLGITVFSLVERDRESGVGLVDYINLGLAGTTLLINLIALSAILFRLASYGFTPNRVAVLGTNLVIFVHLIRICLNYLRVAKGQAGFEIMERVIGRYLPIYGGWAACVAFLLPLLFGFE